MPETRPSIIDAILSTRFDECSIAAADTATLARERTSGVGALRHVQPIGRYETEGLEEFEFYDICTIPVDHEAVVGGKIKLSFVTHPEYLDLPVSLVAVFNQDSMLPIASFEKRANGQCSYVQLGQELDEDKLVVTADASRTEYVEAIRSVLSNDTDEQYLEPEERSIGHETDEYRTDLTLIKNLIISEINEYRPEVEKALAPAACRLAERFFSDDQESEKSLKEITILNDYLDDTGIPPKKFLTKKLTLFFEEDELDTLSGRRISLVLARELKPSTKTTTRKRMLRRATKEEASEEAPEGNLQLLAMVRGGVGIRLAQFHESGIVTLENFDQIADSETLACLLKILPVENKRNRKILQNFKSVYQKVKKVKAGKSLNLHIDENYVFSLDGTYYDYDYDYRSSRYDVQRSGIYLKISYGNYNPYEPGRESQKFSIYNTEDWDNFRILIAENWRLDSDIKEILNSRDDETIPELYRHLRIAEQLESYLGPGNTPIENLIVKLGDLVAKGQVQFEGVLTDRKAGKTRTNVNTGVTITNGGRQVRITVSGRPTALEGFNPVTLFDETLRFDSKNTIPDDKVREITEVVGAICVERAVQQ